MVREHSMCTLCSNSCMEIYVTKANLTHTFGSYRPTLQALAHGLSTVPHANAVGLEENLSL